MIPQSQARVKVKLLGVEAMLGQQCLGAFEVRGVTIVLSSCFTKHTDLPRTMCNVALLWYIHLQYSRALALPRVNPREK